MLRPCLTCGALTRKSRCLEHERAQQRRRDQWRGTPAQRGYDATYLRNRRAVLANGPHPCAWGCGRVADTVDHIIPLAMGGTNEVSNLMPSCKPCNSSRGSRPAPSEWMRSGR